MFSGRPLSVDEMRILNIVLVEYLDELKHIGLCFETAIADQPATDQTAIDQPDTDQPVITKKRVVECLQKIQQHELAKILSKKQGEIFTLTDLAGSLLVHVKFLSHNFIFLSFPFDCVHIWMF